MFSKKLTDTKNVNEKDIDGLNFFEKIKSLLCFTKEDMSPIDVLNYIYENNLIGTFPNIAIDLRISLTLPVSVASGERSFSKLKIKKKLHAICYGAGEIIGHVNYIHRERNFGGNYGFIKELIGAFVAAKARRINI